MMPKSSQLGRRKTDFGHELPRSALGNHIRRSFPIDDLHGIPYNAESLWDGLLFASLETFLLALLDHTHPTSLGNDISTNMTTLTDVLPAAYQLVTIHRGVDRSTTECLANSNTDTPSSPPSQGPLPDLSPRCPGFLVSIVRWAAHRYIDCPSRNHVAGETHRGSLDGAKLSGDARG